MENVVQRLAGFPILVSRPDIKNLNVVIILRIVRMPNGRRVRRVVSVQEITGYDTATDQHRFLGRPLLERRVEPRLAVKTEAEPTIRLLIEKRQSFLEDLIWEGIGDFDKVHTALAGAYRQGLFR